MKRKYRLSVWIICIFSTVFSVLAYFMFQAKVKLPVAITCFFLGFFMVSIMAVSFDYGVELTYPIGESFSTGVLMSSGQIWGIIYTIICSRLIDSKGADGSILSLMIFIIATGFSVLVCVFLQEKLKRFEEEQRKKKENEIDADQVIPRNT